MWTLDNIRLYTQDYNESAKQNIARLSPLDEGTILHRFGYETKIIKIQAVVVGYSGINRLDEIKEAGNAVLFTPANKPESSDTPFNVYLNNHSARQRNTIYQSLDLTQSCLAPLYDVDLELYPE